MRRITVARNGPSDFPGLRAAIESIPSSGEETVILLKNGTYREKIEIRVPGIRIVGEDRENTKIVFGDGAKTRLSDGSPMGTFNSFTLYAGAPDIRIENVTIENSAGDGRIAGQAVALYADADRLSFVDCALIGFQDTLCTGPLPRDPIPKGVNPRRRFEGYDGEPLVRPLRQYYEGCFIRGDIDFIFGSATAVFNGCEISSRDRNEAVNGFVTAASTYPGQAHGFVFTDCRLTGEAADGSVYLGRPWRNHARTVFIDCWLGPHIKSEGWHNWDKREAETDSFYGEYGSRGPGANPLARAGWAKRIREEERASYTIASILSGGDGWNPVR